MRISDWSSDVCSSDLPCCLQDLKYKRGESAARVTCPDGGLAGCQVKPLRTGQQCFHEQPEFHAGQGGAGANVYAGAVKQVQQWITVKAEVVGITKYRFVAVGRRSEEKPSELQSLM